MRNQKIIGEGSKKKERETKSEKGSQREMKTFLLREDRTNVHGFVLLGDD